jgi:predicted transcriptional regulator
MNKKRNRLEVIKDILEVIRNRNGRIKPTHILYKSNLSYQMMEDYLSELKGKRFITEIKQPKGKTYAITDKGIQYLQQYKTLSEFTQSFGLE